MKKMSLRNVMQFLVLCIGANLGLAVYMLRSGYYDAFLEGYGINNTQFGTLISLYGTMTIATYFLGGILADKFSPRKMIAFSMLANGLCTIYLGTFPSYGVLLAVYTIMGITSTLTFWAALIKITRQFGKALGGEGKALGGLEGGRAFAQMAVGSIALLIATRAASATAGLRTNLFMCGGILSVMGILAWFVFTDENESTSPENPLKLIVECLKNPSVWVASLIVMGCYAVTSSLGSYASKMATVGFGATAATGALIGLFNQYFNPFGSIGGGFISDRIGAAKSLSIASAGMAVIAIVITLMPKSSSSISVFMVVFAILVLFVGFSRGQFYATLQEAKVPLHLSGTAIGLIAMIGYTPDMFMPLISGRILDKYEGTTPIQYMLIIAACFAVFAFLMTLLFRRMNKKNIAELNEEKRRNRAAKKAA